MKNAAPCLFLLFPLFAACQDAPSAPLAAVDAAPAATLPVIAPVLPLAVLVDSLRINAATVRFHVDKSDRRFDVYAKLPTGQDTLLKTYPCVLGERPVGDKFHQGDRKTPEGTFGFRSKRVHNDWHKFIWVDYPNAESWKRYKERQQQGLIPAGKDIGGEIGIHGVPDGMDHWIDAGQDWTWGCIALKNTDVDEIYPYITVGKTMIEVVP